MSSETTVEEIEKTLRSLVQKLDNQTFLNLATRLKLGVFHGNRYSDGSIATLQRVL